MSTTERDRPGKLPLLARSLVLPFLAAAIGGTATARSLDDWYANLEKPPLTPPGAVFGPVWTTLYLLMGIAHFLVSQTDSHPERQRQAQVLYGAQLALNALWSVLFFGLRSPLAGLVEIGLLWLAILLTVVAFARISLPAALLLLPYLAWVSLAAFLNFGVWRLNG